MNTLNMLHICTTLTVFFLLGLLAQPKVANVKVENYVRFACELAWPADHPNHHPAQVDDCVNRAMAALSTDQRLRDNELKSMVTRLSRELKACKEAK